MAITIFHRVVNINKVHIVNKKKEPEQKAIKVKAGISTTRHTITEVKE